MKWLAIAHRVWGAAFLALAALWAVTVLRILPHMSTGTVLSNLPAVAMLAIVQSGPLIALGVLMFSLAGAIQRRDRAIRTRLLWTHAVIFAFGVAAMASGVLALQAAERSAARGGGLLGGFGLIPLGIGAVLAVLSGASLVVAYVADPAAKST